MALECMTIDDANDFLSQNTNMIRRDIARNLRLNAPWADVFGTDIWYANTSIVQRSVVQQNVCVTDDANNLSFPEWDHWSCDFNPKTIEIGTCEYQYQVDARDFKGPTFCVAVDHHSLKGSIKMAEKALKDYTMDQWNAMNRKQALVLSGTKMLINSGLSFDQSITQGFMCNFVPGVLPDSPLNWQSLQLLSNFVSDELLIDQDHMWGTGGNQYLKFIGASSIINQIRDEAGTNLNLIGLAAGAYKPGRDGLDAFRWEGPYRGIMWGVDQRPLRLRSLQADGSFTAADVVAPFTCAAGSTGTSIRVANPEYGQAPYEVAFLLGRNTIFREIPEQFLGEGTTKFDRQYWGGDVQWINNKDQTCNPTGDRGYHLLRFAAAYRPEYPKFIVPIIYGRCTNNLDVTPCDLQYYTSGEVVTC